MEPESGRFTLYRQHTTYTIRVSFPMNNLVDLLNSAKIDNNDPLFYHSDFPLIQNVSTDKVKSTKIIEMIESEVTSQSEGTEVITVDDVEYMVNFVHSKTLDWYILDYVPLEEVLKPIQTTVIIFYIACILLGMTGLVIALFLYRRVQLPMLALLKGVRLLKQGSFSYRIRKKNRNEFDILYSNFNDMASQIEDLIEKVLKEKIASREALVKQLQAQINPHFLYNCLFFIDNMTRLGNDTAVIAMTKNLAQYFRYSTRLNEPVTSLEKEVGVVENYLQIQCLRMERLQYKITIPDSMKNLQIPKLLIQPLIENSVIHGIEKKQQSGWVALTGVEDETQFCIHVVDDGNGMTESEIQLLLHKINQPLDDEMGCALWNIQQRMLVHFDAPSGIKFSRSDAGGLLVTLYWPKKSNQEE